MKGSFLGVRPQFCLIIAVGSLLVTSLCFRPAYAGVVYVDSGACYGAPFGAVKLGATVKIAPSVNIATDRDLSATLVTQEQPLPEVPKEISRIRRGYISGIENGYPLAPPVKSWFGVDLERRAAYSIERYSYAIHDPKLKAFSMPRLNGTTWSRKWVGNDIVEIEIVKYLPGNVGSTNFESFVCSANSLWASSDQLKTRSGYTDVLGAYAYVIDISDDGRHSYSKKVMSWDAVYDAILGIRARML